MDPREIDRRFLYHAPTEGTRELHDKVRYLTLTYAHAMAELLDGQSSREISLVFTALEESSFWAHAHIARNLP